MSAKDEAMNLARFERLHDAITLTMDAREQAHQAAIAADQRAPASGHAPLNLLADGDSWFDYPLGGDFPGVHTDVLAQLGAVGQPTPRILSFAHYGYTTDQSLGMARRERLVRALTDPRNGRFDAILMSGGGDNIVGDRLAIWLNDAGTVAADPARALSETRFQGALEEVRAGYDSLARLRDQHAPGVPIVVHAYDYAIPSGRGVCCVGPWLKPSLDYCGWTDEQIGAGIVRDMLGRFGSMLEDFAASTQDVVYVQTQGTLAPDQWANELHPTPPGFRLIADKFRAALAARFPSRI